MDLKDYFGKKKGMKVSIILITSNILDCSVVRSEIDHVVILLLDSNRDYKLECIVPYASIAYVR